MSANICCDTAISAIWKRDGAAVADDLVADLDQLLAQASQRRLRHRRRPHEITEL
jgi:hypothetical protein